MTALEMMAKLDELSAKLTRIIAVERPESEMTELIEFAAQDAHELARDAEEMAQEMASELKEESSKVEYAKEALESAREFLESTLDDYYAKWQGTQPVVVKVQETLKELDDAIEECVPK